MIKSIIQEGFVLKTKGYYKNAIEAFYRALSIDNSSLELLLEIAECYYILKDEERALSYIEQILEKKPTHIESLKLLKQIFYDKKAWNEAEQTAVNIYSITKKEEDFIEVLKILIKKQAYYEIINLGFLHDSSEVFYYNALAKFYLNELLDAMQFINQSIEKNKNKENLLLKSKILFKLDEVDECVQIINNLSLENFDAEALNFIGLVRQYECNYEEAIKLFKQAIQLDSKKDEVFYNLASTYFKNNEKSLAKKFYNLAITLAPENQNYHLALANLYYSEKQYRRALEELKYDFFEANLLKSIILYDSGYLTLARNGFNELLKEQPQNELILSYKSQIEEKLKI